MCRDVGPLREHVPEGVPVHCLSSRGMLASLAPLVSLLRKRRPAVVISHLTHANIVVAAAGVLARFRGRLLLVEHTVYSRKHHGLYGRLMAAGAALTYRRANSIVAVSEPVARDIEASFSLPASKIVVLPNPIDFSAVLELARAPFSSPWVPFFVAVGSLEPEKGFDLLIEAFSGVRQDHDVQLVIVGEGSSRDELEELIVSLGIEDAVHLLGYDANPYRWIRAALALVISSRYEGLPTVAIESAAIRTPVIAIDAGYGLGGALESLGDTVIVHAYDAQVLAGAMERFMAGVDGRSSHMFEREDPLPANLERFDVRAVACDLAGLAHRGST